MTVIELIKELEKMPQDMTVEFSLYDGWGTREEVDFVEIKKGEMMAGGTKHPDVVILS